MVPALFMFNSTSAVKRLNLSYKVGSVFAPNNYIGSMADKITAQARTFVFTSLQTILE